MHKCNEACDCVDIKDIERFRLGLLSCLIGWQWTGIIRMVQTIYTCGKHHWCVLWKGVLGIDLW